MARESFESIGSGPEPVCSLASAYIVMLPFGGVVIKAGNTQPGYIQGELKAFDNLVGALEWLGRQNWLRPIIPDIQ